MDGSSDGSETQRPPSEGPSQPPDPARHERRHGGVSYASQVVTLSADPEFMEVMTGGDD